MVARKEGWLSSARIAKKKKLTHSGAARMVREGLRLHVQRAIDLQGDFSALQLRIFGLAVAFFC